MDFEPVDMNTLAWRCFNELPIVSNENPERVRSDLQGFRVLWEQKDDPNSPYGWTLVSLRGGVGFVAQSYAGQKWRAAVKESS